MGGNGFLDWLCNRSIQVGLIYYLNTASVGGHFKRDIEFSNRRNNILLSGLVPDSRILFQGRQTKRLILSYSFQAFYLVKQSFYNIL